MAIIKYILHMIIWAVVFGLVYSFLFGIPINNEITDKIQHFFSDIQNKLSSNSPSLFDLIKNPENYENEEVSYRRAVIKMSDGGYYGLRKEIGYVYTIKTQEEDGTWIAFPVHYNRSLVIYNHYDLKGIVKKHESGTYYLELNRVVAKD